MSLIYSLLSNVWVFVAALTIVYAVNVYVYVKYAQARKYSTLIFSVATLVVAIAVARIIFGYVNWINWALLIVAIIF